MRNQAQKGNRRVGREQRELEPVITFLILGWGIELLLPKRFLDFFRVWLRRLARRRVWREQRKRKKELLQSMTDRAGTVFQAQTNT